MWRHKIRSILAIFGIVWGTIAVVLLLALGEGFYQYNQRSMLQMASGAISFYASTTSQAFQGSSPGQRVKLMRQDVLDLPQVFPDIQFIRPLIMKFVTITKASQKINEILLGVSPNFSDLIKNKPNNGGRFINRLDVRQQRQVIILSDQVQQKLFSGEPSLGKLVFINNLPFTVIGVFSSSTGVTFGYTGMSVIPYTTAIKLWGQQNLSTFMLQVNKQEKTKLLQQKIRQYFSYRYHFSPQDKTALFSFDHGKLQSFFTLFFLGIGLFLGFCGALTLAVGGIGVANMMYLIVSERTAEIGLRMALGAREEHILLQFFLEAGLIVCIGYTLGLMISLLAIVLLQHLSLPLWLGKPQFSPLVGIVTFVALAIIGTAASYFPARRAAKMQPVMALAF